MQSAFKEEPPLEISFQDVGEPPRAGPSRYLKRRLSTGPALRLSEVTDTSTNAMNTLLQEWGLEALAERFAEHLIDLTVLDYIVDIDIVDLCRDLPIRYRLVLRHNLQNGYHKNMVINDKSSKRGRTVITFTKDPAAINSTPARRKKKKTSLMTDPMASDTLESDMEAANFVTVEASARHDNSSETESGKEDEPNVENPMPHVQSYQDASVTNYALKSNDYSSEDENPEQFEDVDRDSSLLNVLREKVDELENQYGNYNDEWENAQDRNMMTQYWAPRLVDMPFGFTDCEGYIPAIRLKMFSDMANSDYLFIKSVMEDLWPEGFAGRSVTGRASNNASGRSGKASLPPVEASQQPPKTPLETHKIEYIRDRLLERRILLGDDRIKAIHECKQANKLMARVIINWNHKSR